MFFRPIEATFCLIYHTEYFLVKYKTKMWLKIAKKTDTKSIGKFLYNV